MKAEDATELAREPEEVFQAAIGQAQPLTQQKQGKQGSGGVGRRGEAARRRRHALRHRHHVVDGTKRLFVHDPLQLGSRPDRLATEQAPV